jgi:hypothetical protein
MQLYRKSYKAGSLHTTQLSGNGCYQQVRYNILILLIHLYSSSADSIQHDSYFSYSHLRSLNKNRHL